MTKKLFFITTILLVVAFIAFAADVTGKWTYETPGRDGGPGRPTTITLKQDGSKLTGSVPAMMGGRGGDNSGGAPPEQEISNGKVDGNKIYFEVKMNMMGNEMITKYEGVLDGNSLKLTITRPGRDGNPQSTEVVAKKGS